jgi:CarD family transcriptional regulator
LYRIQQADTLRSKGIPVKVLGGYFMYNIGDYVVCPGHGVGQVADIETKKLADQDKTFYVIKLITNGMKVMVPVEAEAQIRNLVGNNEIDGVFTLLTNHNVKVDTSTWNRRHRDYMLKVKTGSLIEIADVLRSLFLLKISKKLSFGEKKMLDQCKELLVKEIALSQGYPEEMISGKIEACFETSNPN